MIAGADLFDRRRFQFDEKSPETASGPIDRFAPDMAVGHQPARVGVRVGQRRIRPGERSPGGRVDDDETALGIPNQDVFMWHE